jgi:hypothetical protein
MLFLTGLAQKGTRPVEKPRSRTSMLGEKVSVFHGLGFAGRTRSITVAALIRFGPPIGTLCQAP